MATVLITGSEGNIGSYIVRRFCESHPDWKILRIKHSVSATTYNSIDQRYEGDLRDSLFLKKIFFEHHVDYVIHAASKSYSHTGYRDHPFQVIENDTVSLLNLLQHSVSVSKFIYLSSALLYEHADYSPLLEENTKCMSAPTSSYGIAKWFGESAVQMFSLEHKIDFTIWRPFNIVSPLEPHDGDISSFMNSAT